MTLNDRLGTNYGSPTVLKNHKIACFKNNDYQQGGSRCKIGFSYFMDS
jgi:hypothetical protein